MGDKKALMLKGCDTEKALVTFFLNYFSPESFYDIFYWISGHIDLEQSTPLAKHFCSSKSDIQRVEQANRI